MEGALSHGCRRGAFAIPEAPWRSPMRPTDPSSADNAEAAIREAAREWFVALLDAPTPARQAAFEAWLRADPAHFAAYQAVEAAWLAAEKPGQRLADAESAELGQYLRAMDEAKGERKTFRRLSTLSVILAVVLAGSIWLERPGLLQDLGADHVTARGEQRRVILADGTTVLMDADSAMAELGGGGERRVRLLRGGAFFEVQPSAIPFVVEADNGEIKVLGTGFDVRLLSEGGLVTLEHGRVSVGTDAEAGTTVLEPGQRVRFSADGVGAAETVDLADALAWRGGRFVFYRARLADVVGEIERYRRGRIVIATSTLADERVTGSFALNDTDAALASLQASVGFRMTSVAGRLTVIGP